MLRSSLLAAMVLLVTSGCSSAPLGPDSAAAPQQVFYYAWSGTSPGAGFTFTSLRTFEIDLAAGRIRGIQQTAGAPDPMLPHEEEKVAALLNSRPWKTLSPDEVEGLRYFLLAWLKTDPPAAYDEPRGLGHEDGYVERLTVYSEAGKRTTVINPRGAFPPEGIPLPRQWRALLAAASACAGGHENVGIKRRGL